MSDDTHAPLIDALNRQLSRRCHSLAQYLIDAEPYVPPGGESILHAIETVAAADRDETDGIAEIIQELEGIPQLAPFDPSIAELNYLSVNYLSGVLIEDLEKRRAEEEAAVASVNGQFPPARAALERLAARTRSHLAALHAL